MTPLSSISMFCESMYVWVRVVLGEGVQMNEAVTKSVREAGRSREGATDWSQLLFKCVLRSSLRQIGSVFGAQDYFSGLMRYYKSMDDKLFDMI